MSFKVRTFEEITEKMTEWVKGNTTKIRDFSVGSRTRTILEAVAVVVEELYYRVWQGTKSSVEESIYRVFDFGRLPASKATGYVQIGRNTAATQDFVIPVGTYVATESTEFIDSLRFITTQSVVLRTGQTSVLAPIESETEGTVNNVTSGSIVKFISKPVGVDTVTNLLSLIDGRDEESVAERRRRFSQYVFTLSRGTLASLEFAARQVDGVHDSRAIDNRYLNMIIWNGLEFFNKSVQINNPYEELVPLSHTAFNTSHVVYFGIDNKFNFLYVNATGIVTSGVGVWEYFNGAWVPLTGVVDNSQNLRRSGSVRFTMPLDWRNSNVALVWGFWVRFRVTTTFSTIPVLSHVYASPPPGYVEVFVHDVNGEASPALLASVAESVEKYRGAGVTVNVRASTRISLAIVCNITVDFRYERTAIKGIVEGVIESFVNSLSLGQNFISTRLTNEILSVENGNAVEQVHILSPSSDVFVSSGEVIRFDKQNSQVVVLN